MATSKIEKALQLIADHFASDEANYRNRETGEALNGVLSEKETPAKKAPAKPETETETE